MDKVVIVMPAWNEAENIKEMIEVLVKKEFPSIRADMQLLIVDNNMQTSSSQIVSVSPNISGVKRTWGSIKAMFR